MYRIVEGLRETHEKGKNIIIKMMGPDLRPNNICKLKKRKADSNSENEKKSSAEDQVTMGEILAVSRSDIILFRVQEHLIIMIAFSVLQPILNMHLLLNLGCIFLCDQEHKFRSTCPFNPSPHRYLKHIYPGKLVGVIVT